MMRTLAGLPPGPSGWLRSTIRLIREPIAALREWGEEYGQTFTVRLFDTPIVMTCDTELVRQIYSVRDPELFSSTIPPSFAVLAGAESLLLLSGERHQAERKLLMPAFHGESMRGWATTMAAAARRAFAGGGDLRALDRTRRATLDVIVRVVFGVDESARVDEFTTVVEQWFRTVRPSFLFVRALQHDWLGLSPYARFHRGSERLDALLFEQIAITRRAAGERRDVLASMVASRYDDGSGMSDSAIRDQLRTLLIAGHDTTSVVLAWALHFVARDAEVREHLRAELAGLNPTEPDLLAHAPYLGAVIDETLRLRPVTSDGFRLLHKPWQLGEWLLPAGVAVSAASTLMHARADLWPEPTRFRPERFLGDRPGPSNYFPFGGGGRRCIGASFARFEACVVLGTLLREFDFTLLDEHVEWGRGFLILEPIGGVPMRVQPLRGGQGGGGSGTAPLRT